MYKILKTTQRFNLREYWYIVDKRKIKTVQILLKMNRLLWK